MRRGPPPPQSVEKANYNETDIYQFDSMKVYIGTKAPSSYVIHRYLRVPYMHFQVWKVLPSLHLKGLRNYHPNAALNGFPYRKKPPPPPMRFAEVGVV